MPINNVSSDLGFEGITIGGVPFGGTRMAGGNVSTGTGVGIEEIVLVARQVTRSATISSGGNPNIPLPVAFGKNKFIIVVDGDSYCPGVDFQVTSSGALWVNPNVSIPTSATMAVWGPGNDYTADLITIEPVNMNSTKFNSLAQTIQLDGVGGPAADGIDSVFLVVNEKTQPTENFTIDGNGLIAWNGASLSSLDRVFVYYFNKAASYPYRLPIAQTRLTTTPSLGQTEFSISTMPRAVNAGASQLFIDSSRKTYGKDFSIEYPKVKWFGTSLTGTEKFDLSYIRDVNFLPGAFSNTISTASISSSPSGTTIPVADTPIRPELGLFTINGDLFIASVFSHITMNGSNLFTPEYTRSGNSLLYNPEARLPRYDIELDDELVYSGFSDAASVAGLKIEYFQGYAGIGQTYTLQSTPAEPSKVITWVNGRAYFSITGDIAVAGAIVGPTSNLSYLPADPLADVVIMYFTDASLAAQWNITQISIPTATWTTGSSIGSFTKPVTNKNSSFLFTNGQREDPAKYNVSNNGYSLQNASLAGTIYQSDELILLWI